ncbi:TrmH family RNA methyltransferase [Corynebacterium heidelbergense]|uniref:RNA methyltransferase n=1 Tax=Corynebacterium heidelbergense TaxID=2055947 RepID=A0A364V725_9CORY|nr:RNA methyltransferase [Corynebacterium heidelbergense]RAV32356.1 RNA methyltransferase [Corynebacterium heidelbergense]
MDTPHTPELFTERTPRIVAAAKLHRAAARRKAQRFLAEGENAVSAALSYGSVLEVFATPAAAERFDNVLRGSDVPLSLITDRAAERLSETVQSTGLFALCRFQLRPAGDILPGSRLLSVAVETAEPGNAGTLIRVSDACGADGVIFTGNSVDPLGGKAVRASAGSVFHLPVAREDDVAETIAQLKQEGLVVLATAMRGDCSLDDLSREAGREGVPRPLLTQRTAWLFGNEAHGLGDWLDLADVRVSIPMYGRAESLNLATAASICLYESAKAHHRAPSASD